MNPPGQIINQAYDIIKRTYQEINRLKDDLEDLLLTYDPSFRFADQYSYSPNSLYLKPNHTFMFTRGEETPETKIIDEQRVLAMVCIFYEANNFNRINLKDQPELWFILFDIKNYQKCRPWDIYWFLKAENRKEFEANELMIGGEIIECYFKNEETSEEWSGRFIGFPLVEITDIDVLKDKVIEKLFEGNQRVRMS